MVKRTRSLLLVSGFLLLTLVSWSISSPIGSGVDADFHLGSIWCARGESKGICESIDMAAQPEPTAVVPFMFQMCDGRNIYFWPKCEVSTENATTQLIRIAPDNKQSIYYWVARTFASTHVNRSVVIIRLFNSVIASLMFFALMALSSNRLRTAVVVSWTLTLIPNGIQLLSGINPRSWAVLGIMSSWAFLHAFLTEDPENHQKRAFQIGCFIASISLTASSRFDALLFVFFVSSVVLIAHVYRFEKISTFNVFRLVSIIGLFLFSIQFIPKLSGALSFGIPEIYSAHQYIVFQIVHLPEFVTDWWDINLGPLGSGPGIIRIVGVSLFSIFMFASLQKADWRQIFTVSALSIFILLALFRATTAALAIVPLSGVYTFGLVAPLTGIAVVYSKTIPGLLASNGMVISTVVLVSAMHALSFYHWMEFFTRRGVNTEFYQQLSLSSSWWWNSAITPNLVFGIGAISFSAFLGLAWKFISSNSVNEPEYR